MLKKSNGAIRRGTDNRSKKGTVRLLKGVFGAVYVVGKIFDLIKWAGQFFGE